ncbi:MAG: hypothetical protein IJ832_03355 [Bacteroidaceae bacterium]|nr:hypothetical protein [Bacteroidaceae bacterium]
MILIYIIEGILGIFILIALFGAIAYGKPITWKETDEQRIKRYVKKRDRQRKRERFRLLWPEDENQDMFGNPM